MAYISVTHARSNRGPLHGTVGSYSSGDGLGVDWSKAIDSTAKATSTIADIAAGGPQKREREAKANLEIAKLQLEQARIQAAAQAEAARAQSTAQRATSGGNMPLIVAAVAGVAVLGFVGYMLLKK